MSNEKHGNNLAVLQKAYNYGATESLNHVVSGARTVNVNLCFELLNINLTIVIFV